MKIQPNPNEQNVYRFLCPGCGEQHAIPVPPDPRAWEWNGSVVAPTFKPSIFVNAGRRCPDLHQCHSFVTDGNIQFLSDCSHALAGKTVQLPEIPESWKP